MSALDRSGFWLVWRENGGAPTCRHFNKAGALAEAERLAALNPGSVFFVMKSTAGFIAKPSKVKRVKLTFDEIPF